MDAVEQAFRTVHRQDFLPPEHIGSVNLDAPLPIGYGQTNSQPSTVRMMLEWLDAEQGNKVLDVGSGSGWTTALLARLCTPGGFVYAVEIVPALADFGRDNCAAAGIGNVEFHLAGKQLGLPQKAPYDRILVSAAAAELPQTLIDQLRPGGKMVIPVRSDVLEIEKNTDSRIDIITHPGFAFVSLVAESPN